jgi:hypothetical protein
MCLVTVERVTPYVNLKHAKLQCDCGFASEAMIADKGYAQVIGDMPPLRLVLPARTSSRPMRISYGPSGNC